MTVMTIPLQEYQERRQTFFEKMSPNSLAIFCSAPETDNRYRQNTDFYYLTGFNEPQAVILLLKNNLENKTILFNQPPDPNMEIWHGPREGQKTAINTLGVDEAYSIKLLSQKLPALLQDREILYYDFSQHKKYTPLIIKHLHKQTVRPTGNILYEMRLFKSPAEIAIMRKANDISIQAHSKAMQYCKPNQYEYELQAIIVGETTRHGSLSHAYPPIIGAGKNSCVLHYQNNNQQIHSGDIVLIDAGCELEHYASDITRSFPANGKFSAEQKAIYNIVLDAQTQAIELIKPGLPWNQIHEKIVSIIQSGLLNLNIIHDPNDYIHFYMHKSGHWLGLDTHDVGVYNNRPLEPTMVLTVEPGIYIPANTPLVDSKWWNIGIRIEDDILVTKTGHENFTEKLPKTIHDIESLMNS